MQEEFDALLANNTWDLIPRPARANVVTGKWIFKHKFKAYGSLERCKACLVLLGFTQHLGIDFSETFSEARHRPYNALLGLLAASRFISWL